MSRRLGPFLPLLLVGLLVLMREVQVSGAARIARGEQRAMHVLEVAAQAQVTHRAGSLPAVHFERFLKGLDGVHEFQPETTVPYGVEFAQDNSYIYALAPLTQRDAQSGTLGANWVLRAWPVEFGRTGDAEYQLGSDGVLWEGQNLRGRSGTETGFPPPFPQPDVATSPGHWWTRALPNAATKPAANAN